MKGNPLNENEMPAVPKTEDELILRWAQRDAEYAKSRPGLAPGSIAAVQQGRMREVSRMPRDMRARLFARVKTWVPPVHPEFGSMKDFLE